MNAPRLALLALCAAASTARAEMTATSLQGWTRQDAYLITGGDRLIRGADYKDGVVYCDFRGNQSMMPSRTSMLFPRYPCVVLGWAPKGAPAKAGGLFASGQAYLKQGTGPQLSTPGADTRTLILDINQVPYATVQVMLLAPRATPLASYESYVGGGTHLTQPDPSKQPPARTGGRTGNNGGGPRDPSKPYIPPSMIDRSSPASQWYVFDSVDKGAAAGAPSKRAVYCHIGRIGASPVEFLKGHANTFFECVSLATPVPAVKDKLLKAKIVSTGRAQIDDPAHIRQGSLATLTYRLAAPSTEVLTLKRFRTLANEHPGAENFFPTWRDPAAVPSSETAAPALTDKEKKWLSKDQQKTLLAADKAADARAEIAKNLKPNDAAIAKYNEAIGKTPLVPADVDAALPPVWGGDNKQVVAESGPNADIQLSDAELKKLKEDANKAEYTRYHQVFSQWAGNDTTDEVGAFNESRYDPIALHNAVVSARAVVGSAASTPPAKTYSKDPLTEKERKLLTAKELEAYKLQETEANKPNAAQKTKDAFAQMSADMRKLIDTEGRKEGDPPYPPPAYATNLRGITEPEFDKLPEWQKNKLCNDPDFAGQASGGGDNSGNGNGTFNGAGNGSGNADLSAANSQSQAALNPNGGGAGSNTTTTTSWIQTKCGPRRVTNTVTTPANGGGTGNVAGTVPPLGKDAEIEAKKPNPWLTQDLLTSGAKGAMVGLLVGSLFGPAGLIVGPLVGGALFYGLTKLTSKD